MRYPHPLILSGTLLIAATLVSLRAAPARPQALSPGLVCSAGAFPVDDLVSIRFFGTLTSLQSTPLYTVPAGRRLVLLEGRVNTLADDGVRLIADPGDPDGSRVVSAATWGRDQPFRAPILFEGSILHVNNSTPFLLSKVVVDLTGILKD